MRSAASCGTREGSIVLSLGELFREISHFYECCIYSIHSCFWQSCYSFKRGFGGLEVACWPLVPKFAGSNPVEAVGFFREKKSSARLPLEGR